MLDPAKTQVPVDWEPREYQLPLFQYLQSGGKRAACVWHRRAGKDLTSVNWISVCSIMRPGLYWHLFPTYNQGRKIAWEGMTKTGRKFIDHFPKDNIDGNPNNTEMRIKFKTGSVYQVVGSDNPDRLVGANPVGIILSEYSLQDPRAWDYIRPILLENDGWAVFIYTPRGRNHGYTLLKNAQKSPKWFSQVLDVGTTGAVTEEAIQEERDAGMPEELIQQEFYCSFDAALVGAYYGTAMEIALKAKRIGDFPFDSQLPVHTAWDLGIGDQTVILFYQLSMGQIRIIDCFSSSGEGLAFYVNKLSQGHRAHYSYGTHYAPHDIQARDLSTGRTRLETAQKLGLRFRVVPKVSIEDGIEATRSIMSRIYWNEDKNTEHLIEAARQYHKEWDAKKRCFNDKPYHDWTSDFMDALRYMALSIRREDSKRKPLPTHAISDYEPMYT
jgi:phage terminase large subunit